MSADDHVLDLRRAVPFVYAPRVPQPLGIASNSIHWYAEPTGAATALAGFIDGLAISASANALDSLCRAIGYVVRPPLTHRRGRGVSRAAKRRQRRAAGRRASHLAAARAWQAVAAVAGSARADGATAPEGER